MISDETIILSDIAKMAVDNVKRFVVWLLKGRMSAKKAATVAEFLAGGYMTHDTPINLEAARKIGLQVAEGVPERVYDLFATCCHGSCTRPSLTPVLPASPSEVSVPMARLRRRTRLRERR